VLSAKLRPGREGVVEPDASGGGGDKDAAAQKFLDYVLSSSKLWRRVVEEVAASYPEVTLDHTDDLWIFLRLALVLAVFFAGLACILWVAS